MTSLLYIANPAQSDSVISARLAAKGLRYFVSMPSDVPSLVIRNRTSLGYEDYLTNLSSYMIANSLGTTVKVNTTTFIKDFPINPPSLAVDIIFDNYGKALPASVSNLLDKHSVTTIGNAKYLSYLVSDPSIELLNALVAAKVNLTSHASNAAIHLSNLRWFTWSYKVAYLILYTHWYSSSEMVSVKLSNKRKAPSGNDVDKDDDTPLSELTSSTSTQGQGPQNAAGSDNKDEKDEKMQPSTTPRKKLVHKRSIAPTRLIISSSTEATNSDFLTVAFDLDMADRDLTFVPWFISYKIPFILGNDTKQIADYSICLYKAWAQAGNTRAGKEVTHLFYCIDLALRAEAVCLPIVDNGVYRGCRLEGGEYSIIIKSKEYKPADPVTAAEEAASIASYKEVYKKIAEILGMPDKDVPKMSIRNLSEVAKSVGLTEDERVSLVKYAGLLPQSKKFLNWTSVDSITLALSLISDTERKIPADLPMYPDAIFCESREESVMSAFGLKAPSFNFSNGTKIEVDKEFKDSICVICVSYLRAAEDVKVLLKDRIIRLPPKSLRGNGSRIPVRIFTSDEKATFLKVVHTVHQSDNDDVAIRIDSSKGKQLVSSIDDISF